MNPYLESLKPYPFDKLRTLLQGIKPNKPEIDVCTGQPSLPLPQVVQNALRTASQKTHSFYEPTKGSVALRQSIAHYLQRRFQIPSEFLDIDRHILPLNGTREGLFSIAQVLGKPNDIVFIPDPFYQIYEGAALMVGANVQTLPALTSNVFLFNLDAVTQAQWKACSMVYVCSPSNPAGLNVSEAVFVRLMQLADEYNFCVVVDECYIDLSLNETPLFSALNIAHKNNRSTFKNLLVFHSLSKRSNMAGLRSGFVAGDAEKIDAFLQYRIYHGCTMPAPIQQASIAAWEDDKHILVNQNHYKKNMSIASKLLSNYMPHQPSAGFFILLQTSAVSGETWTKSLYEKQGIKALPLSYLSHHKRFDPYVRISLTMSAERVEHICSLIRTHYKNH